MTEQMNLEDFVELERLYTAKHITKQQAMLLLKSYLDRQIACLREENKKLSSEDYCKDPESFRKKKGAILNRMVYCDYKKELKWAEADNSELEKDLEQHASRYNGEDSGSIIMDIKRRFNGNMPNSDLYAARLLLGIIESKPQDYLVAEGLVKKLLN